MTTLKEVNESLKKLMEREPHVFTPEQSETMLEIVEKWIAGKAVYRFAVTTSKLIAAGVTLALLLKQFGLIGTVVELSKGAFK